MRPLRSIAVSAWLLFSLGCGGVAPDPSTPDGAQSAAPAEAPKPKDAAQRAEALIDGKVGALVWVDRVRKHPVGARLLAMPMVADLLEGTGLDPMNDLERVFVSGPGTDKGRAVMFAEHNLDPVRAHAALESVIQKSNPPGEMLTGLPYEAAKVTIRGRSGVVAFLAPHYLVVVPEDLAPRIPSFVGTGGLADPNGPEAAIAVAIDPSQTVRAPRVPRFPATVSRATATLVLRADGGADVDLVGDDAGEDQAAQDARQLTGDIERATTMKIAFVTIRVIDPIVFTAQGNQVKAKVDLSRAQIDQLLGLAARFAPQ